MMRIFLSLPLFFRTYQVHAQCKEGFVPSGFLRCTRGRWSSADAVCVEAPYRAELAVFFQRPTSPSGFTYHMKQAMRTAVANHIDAYEPLHRSAFALRFTQWFDDENMTVTRVLVVLPAMTEPVYKLYIKGLNALARSGGGKTHTATQALFFRTLQDEASEDVDGPNAIFPTLVPSEV